MLPSRFTPDVARLAILAAGLACAAPAAASLHLVTVSGTLDAGVDGTGVFGPVVHNRFGEQVTRDLTGEAFTARWIYDTAIGSRYTCCGSDIVDGGTQLGPTVPSPVLSASITVGGATFSFVPTQRGQARVSVAGGSNGPLVSYVASIETRVGPVYLAEGLNAFGGIPSDVTSLDHATAQVLNGGNVSNFFLYGYNYAGPGNYLGGDTFLYAEGNFAHGGLTYSVTGIAAVNDGATAATPLLPGTAGPRGFGFGFGATPREAVYVDPAFASGYDYRVGRGPNIVSVLFPLIAGDTDGYDVLGFDRLDGRYDVALGHATGGVAFDFGGAGVDRFTVRGIGGTPPLDPANPAAFVTGLTFAAAGHVDLTQKPFTGSVPEPASWALLVAGFGAVGAAARRRRRSVAA